jgi:hypothetical protein
MRISGGLLLVFSVLMLIMLPGSARAQLPDGAMSPPPISAKPKEELFTETLPVEVALMYMKLNKEQPNFDFLVFANPSFRNDPEKFSDNEAIKSSRAVLEKIFSSFNPETVFYAEKVIDADVDIRRINNIKISGIEPYEPIVYEMTATDRTGLFIRNARSTLQLKEPFEYGSAANIQGLSFENRKGLPVELTIKPLAIDTEGYMMDDGKVIKVLIVDVVEMKIYSKDKERLLLQKRFKNWRPYVQPKEDEAFKADGLIPAPTP